MFKNKFHFRHDPMPTSLLREVNSYFLSNKSCKEREKHHQLQSQSIIPHDKNAVYLTAHGFF